MAYSLVFSGYINRLLSGICGGNTLTKCFEIFLIVGAGAGGLEIVVQ